MKIEIIENYHTNENTYLVHDGAEALVIDPGSSAEKIMSAAKNAGVDITHILLTHCHYDHIEGLAALRGRTGAAVVTGKYGSINITDPIINLTASVGSGTSHEKADIILGDGEEKLLGAFKIKCIYTPGHTNCSVCYLCGNALFAGDTLFLRNVGRWDLPTGNEEALRASIREKLYSLPDDTDVYPGHGDKTSIGYEKKFNFYVKA